MSETVAVLPRAFFVHPSGAVEEIAADGETWEYGERDPSLYSDLLLSGYPLSNDGDHSWAVAFDLTVDPETLQVTAHVCGQHAREVAMGASSALFVGWYVRNAGESR